MAKFIRRKTLSTFNGVIWLVEHTVKQLCKLFCFFSVIISLTKKKTQQVSLSVVSDSSLRQTA